MSEKNTKNKIRLECVVESLRCRFQALFVINVPISMVSEVQTILYFSFMSIFLVAVLWDTVL